MQLDTPKLSKLDLSQNQLTTIRILNHLIIPMSSLKLSIGYAYLDDNPIIDVERLARSSFNQLI